VNEIPEMWIYIDESGNPCPTGSSEKLRHFSVGMLTVLDEISAEPIHRALEALRNDPNGQEEKKDRRTLERGWFHASKDSKNGHSSICKEASRLCPAEFEVLCFDKSGIDRNKPDSMSPAQFHAAMVKLVFQRVFMNRIVRVILVVAGRGTLAQTGASVWKETLIREMVFHAAQHPSIPCCFPEVIVRVEESKTPGIQMVDFLLWAAMRANRLTTDRECQWADRAMLRQISKYQDGPFLNVHYYINEKIPSMITLPRPDTRCETDDVDFSMPELEACLAWTEANIHQLVRLEPSGDTLLEAGEVKSMALRLRSGSLSLEDLRAMARLGIMLIDTVPFYDDRVSEDVRLAIRTKQALHFLMVNKPRGRQIAEWWISKRGSILAEDPAFLGL
jgi:hypothetical protein